MRRALAPSLAALLLCHAVAGRAAERPPASPARAELEGVCRQQREAAGGYFGTAVLRRLTATLENPVLPPQQRAGLLLQLSTQLWQAGEFEQALGRIGEAAALARQFGIDERPDVKATLLYRRGISHLLLAENLNCIGLHTAASCILPLSPAGVHRDTAHTRAAGDDFLAFLSVQPDDAQVRWLLNLSRMLSGDYPQGVPEPLRLPPAAFAPDESMPRWDDVAPALGVNAFDHAGGAVMDDFDGDGMLDLVSSTSDPCGPIKAFRNDGRGGFEDVAAAWGLDEQLGGLNLVQADFDGDGMLDLLVLRGAWLGEQGRIRNSLLRNDLRRPAARFVDVTDDAGLARPAYPTQTAAWADYDADGDLDLYVGNEGAGLDAEPGRRDLGAGAAYPSQLFRNRGDGTFEEVAASAGVTNDRYAKGVAWGDYDGDGDVDLFVSNIGPNRLYANRGDGTFEDVAAAAGVVEPAGSSFASWFFDYDNDGDLDLWVSLYGVAPDVVSASYLGAAVTTGHPVLYRNDGGRFTDVSMAAGLARPVLAMGANYGDLDGDGWPDVYLGTGAPDFDALMPNVMYRNAAGERFRDVTFAGGFGHLQKGHGVAFGDLDNDGDQDLFHQVGGFFPYDAYANALFENPGAGGRWITLRLSGRGANRFGVGARIEVRVRTAAGERSIHALAGSGGSFGGDSLQQEIGLGAAEAIEWLAVTWPPSPGGAGRQLFTKVGMDRFYRVVEGEERLEELTVGRLELHRRGPGPAHSAAEGGSAP